MVSTESVGGKKWQMGGVLLFPVQNLPRSPPVFFVCSFSVFPLPTSTMAPIQMFHPNILPDVDAAVYWFTWQCFYVFDFQVWSCSQCFCIFHLQCIQKWALDGARQNSLLSQDDSPNIVLNWFWWVYHVRLYEKSQGFTHKVAACFGWGFKWLMHYFYLLSVSQIGTFENADWFVLRVPIMWCAWAKSSTLVDTVLMQCEWWTNSKRGREAKCALLAWLGSLCS